MTHSTRTADPALSAGCVTFSSRAAAEKLFEFIGLPIKFKGGSGSPVRAVAIIEA